MPSNALDRRSRTLWALTGLAGLAGLLLLHVWVPAPGLQNSICLFRRLTGIPCPGCGMTRAFAHLAKGEWAAAARDHLLAYPLAAEIGLLWLAWGATLKAARPIRLPVRSEVWMMGHLAVLTAFWLGRAATGTLPW
ncbi:MAG TPA: DUF2752 domain-containing protein [Thermoanaerobaculia bacterium]|jgi:hypothetical protein|nr:DUF2752 domain-containing protein [Thermoanaerobaculia bacterium]